MIYIPVGYACPDEKPRDYRNQRITPTFSVGITIFNILSAFIRSSGQSK